MDDIKLVSKNYVGKQIGQGGGIVNILVNNRCIKKYVHTAVLVENRGAIATVNYAKATRS